MDLLTRGAGFGYIGSAITSLIYATYTIIFFALEGVIIAQALLVAFGLPLPAGYLLSAMVILPLSALLVWRFVPDLPPRKTDAPVSWLQGMKIAAGNGPFMRILISTTVGRIGTAVNTTVVLWFFIFVLGLGVSSGLPVIVYLLAAVFGVPIWVWLGDRVAKHNALIFAVLFSLACFACLLLVPHGNLMLACIVMLLAGLGGGAAATLGLSIAGDVIDLDELRARRSRGGLLVAFWNMGSKFADAIGGFIALMILSSVGFDAKSMTNSPDAIWGLVLTYIIVPWPFFLVSVMLLWRFPITRERQARIRRLVERRALRAAAAE
jgi:Na+/melibiose symporter-like transporter